jgi:ribonuclease D
MTPEQIHRHAHGVLQAIEHGLQAAPLRAPRADRESDEVQERYDRLHTWRKDRARARGVESDVILPRTALWDLARRPPRTRAELATITDFGPWRQDAYGEEILTLLSRPAAAPGRLTERHPPQENR